MKKGGARKGAGLAPDAAGQKTAKHTVTLDVATVSKMKELGAGNLSRGIREAARRLAANAELCGARRASEPTPGYAGDNNGE
mgnify:CR=1 FL=1